MLGYVILMAASLAAVSAQSCSPDMGELQPNNTLQFSPGALGPFYDIVIGFLGAISHKPFPYDEVESLIKDSDNTNIKATLEKVGKGHLGFIIMLGLGLLFIVFSPIVGCCFCCCRCCNNCGGKRHQPQPSTKCCRVLTVSLVLCTLCLAFGVLVHFSSAKGLYEQTDNIATDTTSVIEQLRHYMRHLSNDLQCEVMKLSTAVDEAQTQIESYPQRTLDTFRDLSGLDSLDELVASTDAIRAQLLTISDALGGVNVKTVLFNESFVGFYQKVNALAAGDDQLDLELRSDLMVSAELKIYQNGLRELDVNLRDLERNVEELSQEQLDAVLESVDERMENVKKLIEDDILPLVVPYLEDAQTKLDEFGAQIEDVTAEAEKPLDSIIKTLDDIDESLDSFKNDNSWAPVLVRFNLSTILVVICLFLVVGLLCGCLGHKSGAAPTERTALSNHGGNCLMASVACMFMFAWLLMLETIIFFTLGYGLQYFCEPVFFDKSMRIYATVNPVMPTFEVAGVTFSLDLQKALSECDQGATLFRAFGLEDIIDLDKTRQQVIDANLDPETIDKYLTMDRIDYELSPETQEKIKQFEDGLEDFSSAIDQLELFNDVVMAEKTEEILGKMSTYLESRGQLLNENEQVNSEFEELQNAFKSISQHTDELTETTDTSRLAISETISRATNFTWIIDKILSEARQDLPEMIPEFITKLDNLLQALRFEIGRCDDLLEIWRDVGGLLCKQIGYPIQGLWAGLGFAVLITIPTMIVAVRMAKYLRRMNVQKKPGGYDPYAGRVNFSWPSAASAKVRPSSPPPIYEPTEIARPKQLARYY